MGRSILFLFLFLCSACTDRIAARQGEAREGLGFVFFGDSGTGEPAQHQVAKGIAQFCKVEPCAFVALLGDNFYPSGVQSTDDPQWQTKFETVYQHLGLSFFPALGNHDYGGKIQAQVDYAAKSTRWKMAGRYYRFQKGEADLFVLDTQNFDKKQQTWLKGELAASTAKWKVVYGHHPIYSYGVHGSTPKLVENLRPLLRSVDFYLCGHEHDKQVLQAPETPPLIISGASATLRPVRQGPYTLFSASTLGFAHLKLGTREATLKILDAHGNTEFQKAYSKR